MDTTKLLVELLDGDDGGTVLWTGAGADLCNDNYGNEEVAEAVAAIAAGTVTEVKVGGGATGAFIIRKV